MRELQTVLPYSRKMIFEAIELSAYTGQTRRAVATVKAVLGRVRTMQMDDARRSMQ